MTKEKQPVGALIKSQRFIRDNGPLSSNSSVRKMGISLKISVMVSKQANCQVAVSLSLANDAASLPVAYRLYLPKA
jgi:DDE superfamily endonuclease